MLVQRSCNLSSYRAQWRGYKWHDELVTDGVTLKKDIGFPMDRGGKVEAYHVHLDWEMDPE